MRRAARTVECDHQCPHVAANKIASPHLAMEEGLRCTTGMPVMLL